MKFLQVFNEAICFWPSIIKINDGKILTDSGGLFPTLSQLWDKAEIETEEFSENHKIMTWAIFNGLHKLAINEFAQGNSEILINAIDLNTVEKIYLESINESRSHVSCVVRKGM